MKVSLLSRITHTYLLILDLSIVNSFFFLVNATRGTTTGSADRPSVTKLRTSYIISDSSPNSFFLVAVGNCKCVKLCHFEMQNSEML